MPSIEQFKKRIIRETLFSPCSLPSAMKRLGFVQADPIRSPARAQDLILRHRVENYKAGDLERKYPRLQLEECFLYAYGFLSKELWHIIHPKLDKDLDDIERSVLDTLSTHGPMHPRMLEAVIGSKREQNYWGGYSSGAKMLLESLHEKGLLRISSRSNGFRVYGLAEQREQTLAAEERFKRIMLAALRSMGATTRKFIVSELNHFKYLVDAPQKRHQLLQELIDSGEIRVDQVSSIEYVSAVAATKSKPHKVELKILAPFDPIVRDRARFEHLWNWTYRFEAYTPKAKRKLGYYAMPVLWKTEIIGWANLKLEAGCLNAEFGYIEGSAPRESEYISALNNELSQLAKFLGLEEDRWSITKSINSSC
jgi:uncharacterized protein YcaQ